MDLQSRDMTMLARRFILICFLAGLFGAALAVAVAETARPARSLNGAFAQGCIYASGPACLPRGRVSYAGNLR